MKEALVDILACPACKENLALSSLKREGTELLEGVLSCSCGRSFAVTRGIAHLLADTLCDASLSSGCPSGASPPSPVTPPPAATRQQGSRSGDCRSGKSCLVCNCYLGSAVQVELCRSCTAKLLRQGLNKKVLSGLYEALELRAKSNTYTDYTISDQFVEWLAANRGRDARILEIGCGGGYLADTIRREGFENLLASDFNARVVETAVGRFPELQGVVMDSALMAFAAQSLDCIVSVEMVEHLLDPEVHFDEVARVLKPNGVYLLRTPNALAASIYYRMAGRYDMGIWHPTTFSSASLQESLHRRGFEVQHLAPRSLPKSQQGKLPRLLKFLGSIPMHRVPLPLRPSICIVATKHG